MKQKVILAYSGGLDTSVAIKWLKDNYKLDVVTLTVQVGSETVSKSVRSKALDAGAIKALVVDAREEFVNQFIWPSLRAGAVYQGQYPLATALSRPLIGKLLVAAAREEGAQYIAHGCTGKGNDQVRIEVSVNSLAPDLKIIAPARQWKMTRQEAIEYARVNNIAISITKASPYSIDANLWGRSIECGVLENPWTEPPEDVFDWTKSISGTPTKAIYVDIEFDKGVPVFIDGKKMDGISLIENLNNLAGDHGIGRIDHVEDRLVGIKSREIYEAPAASVLLAAHRALEALTLSRAQLKFKQLVATEYADLTYNGLWFSALRRDLAAFVDSTQQFVSGSVRMKLHKGSFWVMGRKSPHSLYHYGLATYDKDDRFDQGAAVGFIKLWGLSEKTQAQSQPLQEEARE
jgi:argininosuccinate synthase